MNCKPAPAKQSKPPRFKGLVTEEFIFDEAPFQQCHASTVCQTSRGLVAAWFGGTKEGAGRRCDLVQLSRRLEMERSPAELPMGCSTRVCDTRAGIPVLFQPPGDAPTLLFFKVGPNPRSWWGEQMVSFDRGRTFTNRHRLPETIDGPVRCKPILLPIEQTDEHSFAQRLLCGSSTEYDGWRVHFESVALEDGIPSGTWNRTGPINQADEFNAIQPTFLTHADGRLQVLCRTKEGVIASSVSADLGQTWSKLQATHLPNPNSGIETVSLADGRHLLVYNPLPTGEKNWGKRSTLSLAISSDGLHWTKVVDLEKEKSGEFSYPAAIETDDGHVHVTYTWKRSTIKHVVIDPQRFTGRRPTQRARLVSASEAVSFLVFQASKLGSTASFRLRLLLSGGAVSEICCSLFSL